MCGNYKRLNAVTKPDRYPVPNVTQFNTHLARCKRFTKLDIVQAFYQIWVALADIEKTAVTTPFGLFEFLAMPFGL
jgi:cleavage and polyadenylation specificity factor subunit 1